MTPTMTTSAPKRWSCDLCGEVGFEPSVKAANRAWDHHWMAVHSKGGE
jgi:hypothetical protein